MQQYPKCLCFPSICSLLFFNMYLPFIYWLIVWYLTPFSTVFQLYHDGQCTYPCFPGGPLTSTPHNIHSKPLAAFSDNHCRNNRQRWEGNESCFNDHHQSSERILAEQGIELATSCSQFPRASEVVCTKVFVDNDYCILRGFSSHSPQRKRICR